MLLTNNNNTKVFGNTKYKHNCDSDRKDEVLLRQRRCDEKMPFKWI